MIDNNGTLEGESMFVKSCKTFRNNHQHFIDRLTPHVLLRWTIWLFLVAIFVVRVLLLQGWYIITYAVGIYILNQFIAFLTPKIDPSLQECEDGVSLPLKNDEEFRPFMRQLPELKFWYSTFKSLLVGLLCTCFDCLNIPVFWPILVIYFIMLFLVTMKKQIKHMIRFKYIPFTHGKVQYGGNSDKRRVLS